MKTLRTICLLALLNLLCSLGNLSAQPNISVTCTNDGSGLFIYTFTLGNPTYAWGFSTNSGSLLMRSHGVQEVFSPLGWTSEVDANDFITWRYLNNDLVLLGNPSITFAIQSSSVTPVLYNDLGLPDDNYPRGVVVGSIFDIATRVGIAGGYETFSFVGPAIVPEPSSTALFAVAMIGLGYRLFFGTSRS